MRYNGNKFSVYESEEKTVLGLLAELGSQVNNNTDNLENKTDLHGDHKGTWQGLEKPTLAMEGLTSIVEGIVDKTIPDINEEIIKVNNTLSSKADKNEYVKKGEVDLNEMTERTLQAIQGGEGSSFELLSIPRDKSVTAIKTDFMEIGKNKHNKNNILAKGLYIGSSGGVLANELFNTYYWINLEIGKKYTIYSPNNTFFYISQFSHVSDLVVGQTPRGFISRVDTSQLPQQNLHTFIAEGKYLLISHLNNLGEINLQLEEGVNNTSYEEYKEILSEKVVLPHLNDVKEEIKNLKDEIISDTRLNYDIFDLAYIKNNELDCNNDNITGTTMAKYTCCDFGENPSRMMCKARFVGGGTVAIISMPTGMRKVDNVTNRSIHITFNSGGSCSAGVFENKKLTNIQILNYSPLDVTGKTIYEMGWRLNGNTLTVFLPDGTSKDIVDERWGQCNGKYLCWEHFNSQASITENNRPIFKEFYALGSNNELKDYFLRQDGAIGIAPTGQVYAQFRNV